MQNLARSFGRLATAAALVAALGSSSVHAFEIVPIVSEIELPGDAGGIIIQIKNIRNVDLPVSLTIVERAISEDGIEQQTPADSLFVIFPPQAVIRPGTSQSIRLKWAGSPPKLSRSFTLYAAEQDVALPGSESGVKTLLKLGASVHVFAQSSAPKVAVERAVASGKGVRVTLVNSGDRYVYIDELALQFGSKVVQGVELAKFAGRTLLPPSGKRSFVVEGVTGTPTVGPAGG